jgi:hypothetical protein
MGNFALGAVITFGVSAVSALFAPKKTQTIEKGKQEQFQQPKSSYGDFIPQGWGLCRTSGILIWATYPPREVITTETSRGGKGGGNTTKTKTYTYYGDFACIIAEKITDLDTLRFNGKLVWSDGEWDKKYEGAELRIYYGNGSQTADPLLQSKEPSIIPYRHRAYIVVENLPLEDFSNLPPQVSATWRNGTPNLDDVLLDICLESEFLTAGDIDATELDETPVTGFQVNQESTIAEKIQALQQAYFFDVVDGSDKLYFRKQYRASAFYIPASKLATHEDGGERPKLYTENRANLTDLPSQYQVRFFDKNRNLLQGNALSTKLYNTQHENIQPFDYPGCLTASEAQSVANKLLWLQWERAFTQEFYLPIQYAFLEPNDVIEVEIDGKLQKNQIQSLELGANNQIIARCWKYRAEIFGFNSTVSNFQTGTATATQGTPITTTGTVTQVRSGGTVYQLGTDYTVGSGTITPVVGGGIATGTSLEIISGTTQTPAANSLPDPVPTTLEVLDIHQVYDTDPRGLYLFGTGGNGWDGATIYVSRNGGTDYELAGELITRSVFGSVDTVLGTGTLGVLDETNTVEVTTTPYAELESVALEDLDLGKNRALIGDEIIAFQTATLLGTDGSGNRQYELSNLQRGLRGTYAAIATHGGGEDFYLLSGYKLILSGQESEIGSTYLFKALSTRQTLADVSPISITIEGNAFDKWIPEISAFSPVQGGVGTSVKIFGAGFSDVTAVEFGSVAATSFTVDSDTQITAVVDTGTTNGKITLTAPAGEGVSLSEFIIGSIQWGDISGTLSDQADLYAELESIRAFALVMGLVL